MPLVRALLLIQLAWEFAVEYIRDMLESKLSKLQGILSKCKAAKISGHGHTDAKLLHQPLPRLSFA